MKTTKKSALIVKSNVKAGLHGNNHNRAPLKSSGLVVKSNVKADLGGANHNRALLA